MVTSTFETVLNPTSYNVAHISWNVFHASQKLPWRIVPVATKMDGPLYVSVSCVCAEQ